MAEAEATEEAAEIEEKEEEKEAREEAETTEEEAIEEVEEEGEAEAEEIGPEVVEERIYTIPLSRAWIAPRRKRASRAVRLAKSFIEKHMRVGSGDVGGGAERLVISNEVNEKIWSRGIQKPPRRIRVRAVKDVEGTVTVYLAEVD